LLIWTLPASLHRLVLATQKLGNATGRGTSGSPPALGGADGRRARGHRLGRRSTLGERRRSRRPRRPRAAGAAPPAAPGPSRRAAPCGLGQRGGARLRVAAARRPAGGRVRRRELL